MTIWSAAVLPMLPVLAVFGLATLALWIYEDAGEQEERGTPVVFATPRLRIDTPVAWAIGGFLFSLVVVPLYLVARNRTPARRS